MARIRAANTAPELSLRRGLHRLGFRFRLHRRGLAGTPDLVLPKFRAVVFVHGCFWHMHAGCRHATMPSTRREFWAEKLARNRQRDEINVARLARDGWRVLVVWECALRRSGNCQAAVEETARWLHGRAKSGQIAGPSASFTSRLDPRNAKVGRVTARIPTGGSTRS